MFNSRQPRKFSRVNIFTDEKKEKLQRLVDQVKQEQGLAEPEPPKPYDPTKFKGKFSEYTPRAKRHHERNSSFGWPAILLIIVVLLVLWHFLLQGR